MRNWCHRVLVLIIFVNLPSISPFHMQVPSRNNNIVYATYVLENDVELLPSGYPDNFFDRLRSNLHDQKIQLTLVDSTEKVDIRFNFYATFDTDSVANGYGVQFQIPSSAVSSVSPYLTHIPKSGIENAEPKVAADLATALLFYARGDCKTADTYISNAGNDAVNSETDIVDFYKGNCAIVNNDFEAAIEYLQKAVPIEPDLALYQPAVANLAWAYFQSGNKQQAFETFQQSLDTIQKYQLTENVPEILSKRAQLYALDYRYDDAVADMNSAIQLDPTNPELYSLRAQMYLYLYEWDNVLADYNKAIELDPSDADAYFGRGVLYYSILQTGAEHYPDALADFQHYLQLAPNGDHASDAQKYADQIQAQQNALNP